MRNLRTMPDLRKEVSMSEIPFKKERNVSLCKVCQKLVVKITDAKYDAKNFRYIDDAGKFWNGKTCPACHKTHMKLRMKTSRAVVPDDQA